MAPPKKKRSPRIMVCANCGNEWEEIEQPKWLNGASRMVCFCTVPIDWSEATPGLPGHVIVSGEMSPERLK